MLNFLSANISTIIVGVPVFVVISLITYKLIDDKIHHRSSCGGGCSGCPNAGNCHSK